MLASTPQAIAIYNAYPRRVKRPLALRAILKAIQKFGSSFLLERTVEFARRAPAREMQFIPHPSTFFNQEMFNDDYDAIFPPNAHQKHNPRLEGVAAGVTDYGAAAKRKLERQALEAANQPPPQAQGNGG